MNKIYFYLQIIITCCIIICVKCRIIRASETELLETTSETVQSCQAGGFESLFGTEFQVPQDSNLTILIKINDRHPSLNGEPPMMRIFKDNEKLEFLDVFPAGSVNFPIEFPLVSNFEPGRSNIFIVYESDLIPIALKMRSAQMTNNGEYRIEIGTRSTSVLATATSNLQLITTCDADPNRGIIKTNDSDVVFEEVGNYEGKFGGRVRMPAGSTYSLKISLNELHPALEGETPQVTLYKDGVKLRFQFGLSSEGQYPLEPDLQRKYPNIYILYDFGFVFNSLIIRDGNSKNNGEYTLTVSTPSRFGIANATTSVWFSRSTSPPSLRRGDGNIMVYSTGALNYSGLVGSSFIILSSTWNSIRIIAEDSNNNQDNNWEWYYTPANGVRRLIEQSGVYTIIQSRNSSTLTVLNNGEQLFGQYSVQVTNSAGSDSESTEINRIKPPLVKHVRSTAPPEGITRIGEHVDIVQLLELDNQSVVIEARDGTGFPMSKTNWFYSKWNDGDRKQIHASEHFEIISTPDATRLVIRNATKAGFGYYFAVASNIAGINEARTILGQRPSLLTKKQFHFVKGFKKGQIGDSFILRGNSQIAIEANARGFPPVSFTWFKRKTPLMLDSYLRKIMTSSEYMIGNTLNKSTLTQLVPIKNLITKYLVRAMNELGKVEELSYVVCGRYKYY